MTKEELITIVTQHMRDCAAFANTDPPPMPHHWDLSTWPTVRVRVYCDTPDCLHPGDGAEVDMVINADGVPRGHCGHCKQPQRGVYLLDDGEVPFQMV